MFALKLLNIIFYNCVYIPWYLRETEWGWNRPMSYQPFCYAIVHNTGNVLISRSETKTTRLIILYPIVLAVRRRTAFGWTVAMWLFKNTNFIEIIILGKNPWDGDAQAVMIFVTTICTNFGVPSFGKYLAVLSPLPPPPSPLPMQYWNSGKILGTGVQRCLWAWERLGMCD